MGETDIWEAGTDTDKTTGRLGANGKVTTRILCLWYFCILLKKQIREVL